MNYTLSYDFGDYNKRIYEFFKKVAQNSFDFFNAQKSEGKILTDISHPRDLRVIDEYNKVNGFIFNVEQYLFYYYLKDRRNFENVLKSVLKLNAISVLDNEKRGLYGEFLPSNKIMINPSLGGNQHLTPRERTRLYVFHELGHLVNRSWMEKVTEYLGTQKALDLGTKRSIYEGFCLLDEAITQDRAEDIAYYYAQKSRPPMKRYVDRAKGMYGGEEYKSNYDFYGELQEPAIMFARTLRGIGKIDDDQKALSELSRRALESNFSWSVIYEYQRDEQKMVEFNNEFVCLGAIKMASYARFGCADPHFLANSKKALSILRRITGSLREYREPDEIDH